MKKGVFFVNFIIRLRVTKEYTANVGAIMWRKIAILQMEDVFAWTSCKVEFINSATKIRALLGTSEFFLVNATNADFIA